MDKNLLRLQKYKGEPNANLAKRLFSYIIDAVLLGVVLFGLILGGIQIVSQTSTYQEASTTLNNEMIECYKIEDEAKVYEFINNEDLKYQTPREQKEIFKDWALGHILLSYQNDPTPFTQYQVNVENPNNIPVASTSTDSLAYFYYVYVKNYNNYNSQTNDICDLMGMSEGLYYYNKLKIASSDMSMWILDEVNFTLPMLKSSFACDLYRYLFIDNTYQTGLTCYNLLGVMYQNLWKKEVTQLLASSRYQEHYQVYKSNYATCSYLVDLSSLICFIISYLGVYILPQVFFKDGTTIGKKLIKVRLIDKEGYQVLPKQIIIRDILQFFSFFSVTLPVIYFAGGLSSGWAFPLFEIQGIGFSMLGFSIIFTVVAFISFIVSCFTNQKRTIADLICSTYLIDLKNLETEEKKPQEVEEEKEEEEIEIVDSSIFKK